MNASAPASASRFLDPAVIARMGTMELRARTIVEGFLQGLHRSPFRGFSVEFAEYRQYMPGDDLSTIDWKVFARTDRHVVKKFEQETNLPCHLLVDASASMAYGSRGLSKLQYASYLAAALAWLLVRQRDAVGLMAFGADVVAELPARSRPGHLRRLLVELERLRPADRSNLARPLHRLAERLTRRGLVVVISDLLDEPDGVVAGLRHVRFRGMEVVVFQVLDAAELTFPFDRSTRFRDLESGDEILTSPDTVRAEYLREMSALTARYARDLRGSGIDYHQVDTSMPLDVALLEYLDARGRAI
ncbi:MAG: DUF58 domain-containing protein [Acidobacteria bacterium]|nr:DUF58 domain-containing protein [Acidobacteriota bacterium]